MTAEWPETIYGVLSWWDYSYWVTYIAHRIPVVNPAQDPGMIGKVAGFLLAQDETSADTIAESLSADYIIIDAQMATSKFWAIASWAGKSQSDYFEVFWNPKTQQQRLYFYPEYYRSMNTRLYAFDGKAQAGTGTVVVAYTWKTTNTGKYKEIVSERQFPTYAEAQAYQSQVYAGDNANVIIVGYDPLICPIPLEALTKYETVYTSEEQTPVTNNSRTATVKIFRRGK